MKQQSTITSPRTGTFKAWCVLFTLLLAGFSGKVLSQVTVSRTTSILAGASPFQDSLWTVDTNTYSIVKRMGPTVSGHTITGINGIATDPTTGIHYAILKESGVSGRVLATINLQNGVCTDIGNLGDNFATLAFNANGSLFGVTGDGASVPETMYRIDKTTGAKTLFRALGAGADGEVIVYCYDNNYFYHWSGNGTVVWQRFDTTGTDAIQTLPFSGSPGGETFGGIYIGNGSFLLSNISSRFYKWDTLGNLGSGLISLPDDLRGLVFNRATTTISTTTTTDICAGSSVLITVTGGVGNYQWYQNGTAIGGATNATYSATTAGVYNAVYTDANGYTDSTATGITVTVKPVPTMTTPPGQVVCNGSMTSAVNFSGLPSGTTFDWTNSAPSIGLASTGSGDITAFSATNATANPVTAVIMVTPMFNGCAGATSSFDITVNPTPTITTGSMPEVCAGSTSASIGFTNASNVVSHSTTFSYTGGLQSWTVPAGVTSITVDAWGAAGGVNSDTTIYMDTAGRGGRVQAVLSVTPGQVLNIFVGGRGSNGTSVAGGAGGFNGGAEGGFGFTPFSGGGGGGATDIRIGGVALTDRVIVAAGGGGAGLDCGTFMESGGNGGGITGADGLGFCNGGNGTGGTASGGGAGGTFIGLGSDGAAGTLGTGGAGGSGSAGGGGGGGYYGGGGGKWDGGAGGSSYADGLLATAVLHTPGVNNNNGNLTITYSIPTTYDIVWSPAAATAGFVDAIDSPTMGSPIVAAVPSSAPAGVYNGTLTVTNGFTGCASTGYPVSVTINPIPDVFPVGSQTVCNGATTTAVTFSGTYTGTTFSWTNSDPSISLSAADNGDIPAFIATNASSVPVTAVITVTPSRLGCIGVAQTFSITVNPTPDVDPSSNQTVCNNTSTASVVFTGSVAGTVFTWTNTNTSIGLGASGSDSIGSFIGIDTSVLPVTSVITVNTTANGCVGSSNSFTITIDPTPVFTSPLNPAAICDNTTFSYTPTSATPGTTFAWSRDTVTGISNAAATGMDDPAEVLMNTTANPIAVAYVYTLTANGCENIQTVNVVVNPTPALTSPLTPPAICDSTEFTYAHTSATAGTTFAWSRATVPGITNPASSGVDTIREVLVNVTPNPISVTYVDTLMANGCQNIQSIMVTVNPKPVLTTPLVMSPVCDGSTITYVPASATTGTTFSWSRGVIAGLSNPAASGADTIMETLHDTSANPVTVIYIDTLKANGCVNTQSISILVYPTPRLSSSLTPPAICDSQVFNYTPMSNTLGTTFAWVRPFVLGIGSPAGSGTDNPNEQLVNNTNDDLNVVYVYTLTANGCTNTQNVTEIVHPMPTLSSPLTASVCSGNNFNYVPFSYVSGATFTWARNAVAGITPAAGSGTGTINEVLTDSALVALVTTYRITLTANGCSHQQVLTVTVNPSAPQFPITTHSPSGVCTNTMYQNFGTSALPPAGQQFHWSATNATVWATGDDGQYCLVNFTQPGDAVITLQSNVTGVACMTPNSFTVHVGPGVSDMPKVVYFNGQFICLQTDEDYYQWGFDDAHTLDSTIIEGERNPNYFISAPDLVNRYYWVMTGRDGCMQKSYFNAPLAITEVNAGGNADVKLYPNPASALVNVEINTNADGKYEVELLNMMGQKLQFVAADDKKASFDVSALPSGTYLVQCYRNGVKVNAQRFIKN